jgi:general secretion pathway protein D
MLELVRRIDVPSPNEGTMHVVALEFADAKKIVGALNEAITGATGAASSSSPTAGAAGRVPTTATSGSALEGPARVSAEDTTNSLLVTSTMRDFASIREVIRQLDRPKRQVYIEAVVMDVSTTRAQQLGLSYHAAAPTSSCALAYGGLNPLTSIAAPTDPSVLQGFALGVRGPSSSQTITLPNGTGLSIPAFGVLLNAMLTTDDADILQTPHILATTTPPPRSRSSSTHNCRQPPPSSPPRAPPPAPPPPEPPRSTRSPAPTARPTAPSVRTSRSPRT